MNFKCNVKFSRVFRGKFALQLASCELFWYCPRSLQVGDDLRAGKGIPILGTVKDAILYTCDTTSDDSVAFK